MNLRAAKKKESRQKILESAARRIRTEGMQGAGIAAVMDDAGLTHGAFYSHFKNKDELARAALATALDDNRQKWTSTSAKQPWPKRLAALAKRYLTPAHRDNLSHSCVLAALCSEAGRSDEAFKQAYEMELITSLNAIVGCDFDTLDEKQSEEALAFVALIIGSITLSRAVSSKTLSDQLLNAAKITATRITE